MVTVNEVLSLGFDRLKMAWIMVLLTTGHWILFLLQQCLCWEVLCNTFVHCTCLPWSKNGSIILAGFLGEGCSQRDSHSPCLCLTPYSTKLSLVSFSWKGSVSRYNITAGFSKVAGHWRKSPPTWLVSAGCSAWHFFRDDVF